MTRLQNAKKQLNEALVTLESAASQVISGSRQDAAPESPSQKSGQAFAGADLSALVDEVSLIEAKLNKAIALIDVVESGAVQSSASDSGIITKGDSQ
jgi:hypothetical protein